MNQRFILSVRQLYLVYANQNQFIGSSLGMIKMKNTKMVEDEIIVSYYRIKAVVELILGIDVFKKEEAEL